MATKVFVGNVSIVANTKGAIALKKDAEGKFSAGNAAECYDTMQALSKSKKLPVDKYSLFVVKDGTEPVLLANRYGNPYIALLPKASASTTTNRKTVTKLA